MSRNSVGSSFAALFKKYRLRSEIETLSEFGDLLAQEGIVYETSLFTRWQNGERVPRDRKILIAILNVFAKNNGVQTVQEANAFLGSAGNGYLTDTEQKQLTGLHDDANTIVLQASLGGLLKDYRTQKNISQIDTCLTLGWKDTNRLNNIEQGIEKPSRELMDEICMALNLKEQEKNNLLLVGNYLPNKEEIEVTRKKVKKIIDDWPYPAVLIDFSWRVLLQNEKKEISFNFNEKIRNEIFIKMPRIIEIVFKNNFVNNSDFKGKELEEWRNWLVELLVHFRYSQQSRTKEKWYTDLISAMMDNALFREIWKKSQSHQMFRLAKHGIKILIHPKDKRKRLRLYFYVVPLLNDPRFELELCSAADKETFNFFHK